MSNSALIELAIIVAIVYGVLALLTWAGLIGRAYVPTIFLDKLPPAPKRSDLLRDPVKFSVQADAFLDALKKTSEQLNQLAKEIDSENKRSD